MNKPLSYGQFYWCFWAFLILYVPAVFVGSYFLGFWSTAILVPYFLVFNHFRSLYDTEHTNQVLEQLEGLHREVMQIVAVNSLGFRPQLLEKGDVIWPRSSARDGRRSIEKWEVSAPKEAGSCETLLQKYDNASPNPCTVLEVAQRLDMMPTSTGSYVSCWWVRRGGCRCCALLLQLPSDPDKQLFHFLIRGKLEPDAVELPLPV